MSDFRKLRVRHVKVLPGMVAGARVELLTAAHHRRLHAAVRFHFQRRLSGLSQLELRRWPFRAGQRLRAAHANCKCFTLAQYRASVLG